MWSAQAKNMRAMIRFLAPLSLIISFSAAISSSQIKPTQRFNQFKERLTKSQNRDFYVVCVARSGEYENTNLDDYDVLFLRDLLRILLNGEYIKLNKIYILSTVLEAEALDTSRVERSAAADWDIVTATLKKQLSSKRIIGKYQKYCEIIRQLRCQIDDITQTQNSSNWLMDVQMNPGLLVFNENFFGSYPLPEEIAKKFAKQFTFMNKVTAINYSIQSKGNNAEAGEVIKKFVADQEQSLVSTSAFDEIVLAEVTKEPLRLANITYFINDGNIVGTYTKRTYNKQMNVHFENLLQRKQAYVVRNPDQNDLLANVEQSGFVDEIPTDNLRQLLSAVVCPQVCSDYEFVKANSGCFIQLVQSNTINVANNEQVYHHKSFLELNVGEFLVHCDPMLTTTLDDLREIYPKKDQKDLKSLIPPALYKVDKSQKKLIPIGEIFKFHFKLDGGQFVIIVNKVE